MDFPTVLNDIKRTVDKELQHFFSEKRVSAEKIHPQTTQLIDQIADLTSRGGKRTRAFLCWLGYEAVIPGLTRNPAFLSFPRRRESSAIGSRLVGRDDNLTHVMMAIELFQSFALIHDDIIDEDTLRRGSPTVHEYFKKKGKRKKENGMDAHHFGESMAILAGDLALVWADELMDNVQYPMTNDQINHDVKCVLGSSKIYQKMKEEVILGQSLDVLASVGLPSADRTTISRYKTARYTVVRPLQIGAALAGAEAKTLEACVPYGLAVGEGYQLRDDFLDGEISHEEFDAQSAAYGKQTSHAIQAIHASAVTVPLFADFARFALNREK